MTPVEDFIAQNYEIVKKFKIAWVLKKRNIPVPLKKIYLPITEKIDWQIATKGLRQQADLSLDKTVRFNLERKNPLIELNSAALNSADFAKLPIKIGLGLDKIFSKFIVNIQALTDNNQAYLLTRQLATGDWQDIWFYLPKNDQSVGIKSIIISLSDNQGFFWWGKPETIALKAPELFVRNQNLAIDESAF